MAEIDPALLALLVCPVHKGPLELQGKSLTCPAGCHYPIFNGVPFLLPRGTPHSNEPWAQSSFESADEIIKGVAELPPALAPGEIDTHVQRYVGDTNSAMYKSVIGRLSEYPIPHFPMKPISSGSPLIDIGCHWGRWCFSAAHEGFLPIGIDPSLGGVLHASRIAKQLGIRALFVCGDARYMPFKNESFDAAYSYSVLQHLSKDDVALVLKSLRPAMRQGGATKLHLLNRYGLRSLQVQMVRAFTKPFFFQTRYWSPQEMLSTFSILGPSRLEVDGFFMQGRYEDRHLFNLFGRSLSISSHYLKKIAERVTPLRKLADNLFVVSRVQ